MCKKTNLDFSTSTYCNLNLILIIVTETTTSEYESPPLSYMHWPAVSLYMLERKHWPLNRVSKKCHKSIRNCNRLWMLFTHKDKKRNLDQKLMCKAQNKTSFIGCSMLPFNPEGQTLSNTYTVYQFTFVGGLIYTMTD